MQANTFPITLKEAFMISPKVKHFTFAAEKTFHYLPGQFITISFEKNDKILKRSYSIANIPCEDNRIEFAAGFVPGGPGSELLFNLAPGDSVNITGPFGRLILKDEIPKRYILVATSTGITPYRAMIDELKKRLNDNPSLQVVILQGVQNQEDILYGEDFLKFSKEYPQVIFQAHLSREKSKELRSHEYLGHVQNAFPSLSLNPNTDVVYLCGNPGMIDDSFNYLKEKGFGIQQIIREKYISAPTR